MNIAEFADAIVPKAGNLYLCRVKSNLYDVSNKVSGKIRVLRYGYHRKYNDNNWTDPEGIGPNRRGPSCLWYGWRDHETFTFLRPEHIEEVIDIL